MILHTHQDLCPQKGGNGLLIGLQQACTFLRENISLIYTSLDVFSMIKWSNLNSL